MRTPATTPERQGHPFNNNNNSHNVKTSEETSPLPSTTPTCTTTVVASSAVPALPLLLLEGDTYSLPESETNGITRSLYQLRRQPHHQASSSCFSLEEHYHLETGQKTFLVRGAEKKLSSPSPPGTVSSLREHSSPTNERREERISLGRPVFCHSTTTTTATPTNESEQQSDREVCGRSKTQQPRTISIQELQLPSYLLKEKLEGKASVSSTSSRDEHPTVHSKEKKQPSTGVTTWDSSLVLFLFLLQQQSEKPTNETDSEMKMSTVHGDVLELGCGVGLGGLFLSSLLLPSTKTKPASLSLTSSSPQPMLDLTSLTMTDFDEECLRQCQVNFEKNMDARVHVSNWLHQDSGSAGHGSLQSNDDALYVNRNGEKDDQLGEVLEADLENSQMEEDKENTARTTGSPQQVTLFTQRTTFASETKANDNSSPKRISTTQDIASDSRKRIFPVRLAKLDWHDFLPPQDDEEIATPLSLAPRQHVQRFSTAFDTIVACDCAYLYRDIPALVATFRATLRRPAGILNPDPLPRRPSCIHIIGPANRGGLQDLILHLKEKCPDLTVQVQTLQLKRFRLKSKQLIVPSTEVSTTMWAVKQHLHDDEASAASHLEVPFLHVFCTFDSRCSSTSTSDCARAISTNFGDID